MQKHALWDLGSIIGLVRAHANNKALSSNAALREAFEAGAGNLRHFRPSVVHPREIGNPSLHIRDHRGLGLGALAGAGGTYAAHKLMQSPSTKTAMDEGVTVNPAAVAAALGVGGLALTGGHVFTNRAVRRARNVGMALGEARGLGLAGRGIMLTGLGALGGGLGTHYLVNRFGDSPATNSKGRS